MKRRPGKFYSNNEKKVMESLGFKPTARSGAGWIEKEDGESDIAVAQLKTTDANSIGIKLEDLEKLEYHAHTAHKIPLFVIQFLKNSETWLLVKAEDIHDLGESLETGIVAPQCDIEIVEIKQKATKKIKSGDRTEFYKEREEASKQWKKRK